MAVALTKLIIGDDPAAWASAGFTVDGDHTTIGAVRIRFVPGDERGVLGWELAGLDPSFEGGDIDGIPTSRAPENGFNQADDVVHPNGAVAVDHVVVATPDLDRSIAALEAVGLEARRTRDAGRPDAPRQQVFFWVGQPILELVGPPEPRGDRPATIWGLTCTVDDLDATASDLGDGVGRVKDAVQPGRRITTLRHAELGVSVPVAFMSPHVRPGDTDA